MRNQFVLKSILKYNINNLNTDQLLLIDDSLSSLDKKFFLIPEFLPYRRVDWTAQRDEKSHSYFCCYGYVCVRVDMRGSGDSEGYYYDEYEGQEQEDCCDVINWISRQEWCNGNVGEF